jgi:hypothetical protein
VTPGRVAEPLNREPQIERARAHRLDHPRQLRVAPSDRAMLADARADLAEGPGQGREQIREPGRVLPEGARVGRAGGGVGVGVGSVGTGASTSRVMASPPRRTRRTSTVRSCKAASRSGRPMRGPAITRRSSGVLRPVRLHPCVVKGRHAPCAGFFHEDTEAEFLARVGVSGRRPDRRRPSSCRSCQRYSLA